MNKQEFQQTIKNMKCKKDCVYMSSFSVYQKGFEKAKELALLHSNSLDEPEKPVVPQFVADWYEEHKGNFEIYLSELCRNFTFNRERLNDKLANWYEQLENKPVQTLVNMHQFGYEVQKEKLYTVEIPNPNAGGHVVLCKTSDGIVSIAFTGMARWQGIKNVQLTESEIKQDFDWAFRWAKEVEE